VQESTKHDAIERAFTKLPLGCSGKCSDHQLRSACTE
jgi:hypothetical protein